MNQQPAPDRDKLSRRRILFDAIAAPADNRDVVAVGRLRRVQTVARRCAIRGQRRAQIERVRRAAARACGLPVNRIARQLGQVVVEAPKIVRDFKATLATPLQQAPSQSKSESPHGIALLSGDEPPFVSRLDLFRVTLVTTQAGRFACGLPFRGTLISNAIGAEPFWPLTLTAIIIRQFVVRTAAGRECFETVIHSVAPPYRFQMLDTGFLGRPASVDLYDAGHGRILTVGFSAANFVSTTKPQIAQRFNVSSVENGLHGSPLASADKQGV